MHVSAPSRGMSCGPSAASSNAANTWRRNRTLCGLGGVGGEAREHAQPVGAAGVELLDRPVVPGRVARAVERWVFEREAEGAGAIEDRCPQAVAVHVPQAQLGHARAVAVVLDARA